MTADPAAAAPVPLLVPSARVAMSTASAYPESTASAFEIAARLGIAEAEVIAVGDGANDLGMLHRAGTGVALHAKPAVAAECDVRVNHGDLTALLYIQGYAQDEFVTG